MKLFKVTKTESGYNWSETAWERYFLANSQETLLAVLRERFGELAQYHYNEEETHYTIEKVKVEKI